MTGYKLPPCEEFDRDLLKRVSGLLCQRGYAPHRTLEISIERGVVIVQGRVPSYYLRQVAVECIKRVAGVTQVVDRIKVTDRSRQSEAGDIPTGRECPNTSMEYRVEQSEMPRTTEQVTRYTCAQNTQHIASAKE